MYLGALYAKSLSLDIDSGVPPPPLHGFLLYKIKGYKTKKKHPEGCLMLFYWLFHFFILLLGSYADTLGAKRYIDLLTTLNAQNGERQADKRC